MMKEKDVLKYQSKIFPCGNSDDCTGCGACSAACPEICIEMQSDDEGFLFPVIDFNLCTDCGICRRICPIGTDRVLHGNVSDKESKIELLDVFAAWHFNELIRRESSSGGVFTALAENILAKNGAVVGASFDDEFVVRHIIIESSEDLYRLRGSKYVQSQISTELYQKIRDLLKQDRYVLFSGTPCQVAGLRGFLKHDYAKLYCCDIVCMGVPSQKLLKKYIDWKCGKIDDVLVSCEFRNKVYGWKTPSMRLQFSDEKFVCELSRRDPYCLAFGLRIALRPACYACNFKGTNRFGDLTIADFWGVGKKYPEYDLDDRGTSLVIVNNKKGKSWLDACRKDLFLGVADISTAIAGNPMLINSCSRPPQRDNFYIDLEKLTFEAIIHKYKMKPPSLFLRVLSGIKWSADASLAVCRRLKGLLQCFKMWVE